MINLNHTISLYLQRPKAKLRINRYRRGKSKQPATRHKLSKFPVQKQWHLLLSAECTTEKAARQGHRTTFQGDEGWNAEASVEQRMDERMHKQGGPRKLANLRSRASPSTSYSRFAGMMECCNDKLRATCFLVNKCKFRCRPSLGPVCKHKSKSWRQVSFQNCNKIKTQVRPIHFFYIFWYLFKRLSICFNTGWLIFAFSACTLSLYFFATKFFARFTV